LPRTSATAGKWVNLLGDANPNLSRVALMFNPDSVPYFDVYLRSFKALPQQTSVEVEAVHVRNVADVELAVAKLGREPGSALIAASDVFILAVRGVILKAADQYRVPVISPYRQFVIEGSLISYGPDTADIFRRSASYVDRVLKGEPPGNLPAQSPVKFELVVSLKTAKALGLSVVAACTFTIGIAGKVLTFLTRAWLSFAQSTCQMSLGQYQDIHRTDPEGRVNPRF